MFNVLGEINWIAVAVATVVLTVLAGVYFGAIIAKQYALALGRNPSEKADFKPITIVGPMIANLVTIITSAILFHALNIDSFTDAITFGLLVGIGYFSAMILNIAINPNFPKPFAYTAWNAPYFIVAGVITAVILQIL